MRRIYPTVGRSVSIGPGTDPISGRLPSACCSSNNTCTYTGTSATTPFHSVVCWSIATPCLILIIMDRDGFSGAATIRRLSAIPWCRILLESPAWTRTRAASRIPKASTEDSFFAETLGTQRNVYSCTALRPTAESNGSIEEAYYEELMVIYELGDGVNGWPSKCLLRRLFALEGLQTAVFGCSAGFGSTDRGSRLQELHMADW